ncbi:MAG: L,D-transpeptidase family protein [Desulfatiglans sp.]|nr:L,D-transpeptidase family protein [Desulfatiglans sp.]
MKIQSEIFKKTGLLFFILITFFTVNHTFADKVSRPLNVKKDIPASLLGWNSGADYAVLVDKSKHKVMIYKRDDLYNPYRVYDCSTGENNGPKQKKDDKKTPEGIYFFTQKHEGASYGPIYGAKVLPLNYPNIIDEREGKGGYGIWFHGTNKEIKPNDTKGCVALNNKDIEELADIVTLYDTPVIIGETIEYIPEEKIMDQKREIENIVESWRSAWAGKEIDKYMSFYSRKFKSGSKGWEAWRDYKKQLAKQYKKIDVEVNDMNLFSYNGVIVAAFEQRYRTSGFDSVGHKKLYLTQNSKDWKIIAETFDQKARPKVASVTPQKKDDFSEVDIKAFLTSWKTAWEKKDISAYMACYDKGFKSRGMNIDEWEKHRDKLNKRYDKITVDISKLKIQSLASGGKAKVTFVQKYRADNYRDNGKKTILLVREGKEWRIMEEDWQPTR